MKTIIPDFKEPSIKSILYFEFKSYVGRKFYKKRMKFSKPTSSPYLVDVGVGANYTKGWIHIDFFTFRLKFWKRKKTNKPEVEMDLRFPFNCPDNICDGVYSSHTLEHLYPDKAYQLLNEILRILKPNAWLRISVPDLERLVKFYNKEVVLQEYTCGAEAISHYTQNWGHHSAWDEELLTYALKSIGFVNIRKVNYGIEGSDSRLIKEQESRKEESLIMEAQKPKD